MRCFYCFKDISRSDLKLRCTYDSCPGGKVDDDVHKQYLNSQKPIRLGKVFEKKDSLYEDKAYGCPDCGKEAIFICPHCHNEIPSELINKEVTVISLIGGSGVGKTHYLTMLFYKVLNSLPDQVTTRRICDKSYEKIQNDYNRYIKNYEVIPRTVSASADYIIRYPLIIALERRKDSLFTRKKKSIYLAIYDAAGEDFLNNSLIKTNVGSIQHSDGWLFLVDPLQFPYFQNSNDIPSESLPDTCSDQTAILERAISIMQNGKNQNLIEKPIAFTLTKLDVLEKYFKEESRLLVQKRIYKTINDMSGIDITDGLVKRIVTKFIDRDFITKANTYFSKNKFFSISAVGSTPKDGHIKQGFMPIRLEDPLFWILTTLKRSTF